MQLWPLLLLQADALEEPAGGRKPSRRCSRRLALAPDQPLLLNFMGYAKLEHGEDLDAAEAMIRKASELAPDNASITDSLGWAQFKRGKIDDAIATLQRAAEKDPDQAGNPGASRRRALSFGTSVPKRASHGTPPWSLPRTKSRRGSKAKLACGLTPANAAP